MMRASPRKPRAIRSPGCAGSAASSTIAPRCAASSRPRTPVVSRRAMRCSRRPAGGEGPRAGDRRGQRARRRRHFRAGRGGWRTRGSRRGCGGAAARARACPVRAGAARGARRARATPDRALLLARRGGCAARPRPHECSAGDAREFRPVAAAKLSGFHSPRTAFRGSVTGSRDCRMHLHPLRRVDRTGNWRRLLAIAACRNTL